MLKRKPLTIVSRRTGGATKSDFMVIDLFWVLRLHPQRLIPPVVALHTALVALNIIILLSAAPAGEPLSSNRITNGDFQGEIVNHLPSGWKFTTARPSLAPEFRVVRENGKQVLRIRGAGNPDCVGWVSTRVRVDLGTTYWLRAHFRKSESLNPIQHLVFMVAANGSTQGIAEYHRLNGDQHGGDREKIDRPTRDPITGERVEAEGRICFPGQGTIDAEVRILYRLCSDGEVRIEDVSLTETTPLPPRWVRVGCTQGPGQLESYGLKAFSRALDAVGRSKADLMLLPEYFAGEGTTETLSGPSARLMAQKAAEYRMYVAGTIGRYDPPTNRLYNSALLFDRGGKLVGYYDKIHLYGPELNEWGVTPGDRVPIFETDFGKVGFMTCSDSWFTDVAELVALRGADILLFPNLGYDRALMHARSRDNRLNLATSSRSGRYGVWDAAGRDLLEAPPESGPYPTFKDLVQLKAADKIADVDVLVVSIDLNAYWIQERNGGSRAPVIRSPRDIGNARLWLENEILREKQRWWTDAPH